MRNVVLHLLSKVIDFLVKRNSKTNQIVVKMLNLELITQVNGFAEYVDITV